MYIFAIILFACFAFLEIFNKDFTERNKIILALICFMFLIFHDGLRWETGTDWIPYSNTYDFFNIGYSYASDMTNFEPGYLCLMGASHLISDDYTVYLVIHALIFYTIFFFFIFKLSNFPFVSILLFYTITLPYLGMNRQFIAMAIYAIALIFLIQKKRMLYLLFIFIAYFFHHSAIIAVFAIFFNKKIPNKYLIGVLSLALIIAMSGIINKLSPAAALILGGDLGNKADIYTNMTNNTSIISTILSLIRKFIWIALILIFKDKIDDKDQKFNLFFNLYILSCIIYVLFNNTPLQIIISRALIYYNIAEIFIVTYALTIFKPNYGKLILMCVLTLYCGINIQKGFSNYAKEGFYDLFEPYKGIFINTDYVRQTH